MKQKDIALVVVIGIVSLVVALIVSNLIFGSTSASRNLTAEKVTPISDTFTQPDTKYFNTESLDPTETIEITNNTNQTPFNQEQ